MSSQSFFLFDRNWPLGQKWHEGGWCFLMYIEQFTKSHFLPSYQSRYAVGQSSCLSRLLFFILRLTDRALLLLVPLLRFFSFFFFFFFSFISAFFFRSANDIDVEERKSNCYSWWYSFLSTTNDNNQAGISTVCRREHTGPNKTKSNWIDDEEKEEIELIITIQLQ